MTYRRRYQGVIQLAPVLDLLLIDEINPRSVAFQLSELHQHIQQLPRSLERPFRTPEERAVLKILTNIRLLDIEELCTTDEQGTRTALQACLSDVIAHLPDLSNLITLAYLSHAQTQPQRR